MLTPEAAARYRDFILGGFHSDPGAWTASLAQASSLGSGYYRNLIGRANTRTTAVYGAGGAFSGTVSAVHERHGEVVLYRLYVAPAVRRAGVATALIEDARAWACSRWRVSTLAAMVTEGNAGALACYAHLGFAVDPAGPSPLDAQRGLMRLHRRV